MALTVKRIERITTAGRYHDAHGLYMQVTPSGVKSWLLRYQKDGKEHALGLGPLHTFNLEEARERARKQRQLLADGIDPLEQKRQQAAQRKAEESQRQAEEASKKTFAECVEAFLTKHSDGWKNQKHRWQWRQTLEAYANPVLGKLCVSDIDTPHIVQLLEPIWNTKRETARRTLARVARVLNYAKAAGFRAGDNPAQWSGHLKDLLPSNGGKDVEHLAALPYSELPSFMAALREGSGVAARAMEFCVLTAARTGETIGATWDEIDLKAKTWTVPAARMKMGKEHKVPLSARAIEILQALPREANNPHVFVGQKQGEGLSNTAMTATLKRMGRSDITMHGFRSTFRTWSSEQTAFPHEVCEQALAHTIANQVERAYRRGSLFDKRKQLMDAWAKYCASPPAATKENVVPLRSA
jgi:integrase